MGTKVLIDGRGRGSLIMDPSFVEKRFFVRSKRYIFSHLTEAYQAGLRGNLLQVYLRPRPPGGRDRADGLLPPPLDPRPAYKIPPPPAPAALLPGIVF